MMIRQASLLLNDFVRIVYLLSFFQCQTKDSSSKRFTFVCLPYDVAAFDDIAPLAHCCANAAHASPDDIIDGAAGFNADGIVDAADVLAVAD
jgi:hypothetical protein